MVICPETACAGCYDNDITEAGAMNKKNILLVLTCIVLFICGYYFFISDKTEPVTVTKDKPENLIASGQSSLDRKDIIPPETLIVHQLEEEDHEMGHGINSKANSLAEHPKDIEEIKKQIYELEIEYVEDIAMLDEVVQIGDVPAQELWLGGWESVDDWKEEVNGFNLVPQGDGTFIFYPDEATTRTYTFFETPRTYMYDQERREFYWEMDYYGKTISHIARFINEDVLATMLISGDKVTLDIYRKQPSQNE